MPSTVYLKGINVSGNLFSRISFFRNFAEKGALIFTDFRNFILNGNFTGTYFRVQQEKPPNKKPPPKDRYI